MQTHPDAALLELVVVFGQLKHGPEGGFFGAGAGAAGLFEHREVLGLLLRARLVDGDAAACSRTSASTAPTRGERQRFSRWLPASLDPRISALSVLTSRSFRASEANAWVRSS